MKRFSIFFLVLCLLVPALYLPSFAETAAVFTPSMAVSEDPDDHSYWTTPMDITDEEAVWAMLTAPSWVLDGQQQEQVTLREMPDANSAAIGDVTCYSQGVQVLGGDENGWTKIRCYSSSFHDSKVKAWNALVEGYVPTNLLKKQESATGMGLVVDKLTQRLYVFTDGHLFATLAVSTGLANEKQPYNETRSGEFFLVSKVGDFKSDNMTCEMALRFNDGDLLHQVPYLGNKDYDICESKLGERASHGCIRVQRKRTPEGVNMRWIYEHYEKFTKIVIWEDYEGRVIPPTDPETVLYYNPKGGRNYHTQETCYGVRAEYQPMTAFTFSELDDEAFRKLTPCPYCNPPKRDSGRQ